MAEVSFEELFDAVQKHIADTYFQAISEKDKQEQVKKYITSYIRSNAYTVEGYTSAALAEAMYREMVQYSFLTPYLTRNDIEEININAWNDVAITYTDGRIEKIEHFRSAQHAIDIVKRLLQHSNMIIDDAQPVAQGHLPNNSRITALKTPIVDADVGISASIRLLHSNMVNREQILANNTATEEMFAFLCMCLWYGVSFVIAGETSSGKTTLLNALLSTVPTSKRVFTIESGARELELVMQDEAGNVVNNVVHTLSKPVENKNNEISQEDLVVASLRFNPDIVVVGEMRDSEAYSAVEAALTGHTVVSTVHAYGADVAYTRLALLCQKRFPIDFNLSMMQVAQAFPLIVYERKLQDNSRKIMDICECIVDFDGRRSYHSLYRYVISRNSYEGGKHHIEGHFERSGCISESLLNRLILSGAPQEMLHRFAPELVP